jgi:hypothetical protein
MHKVRYIKVFGFGTGRKPNEELTGIDYYPIFLNLKAFSHEIPIHEIKNNDIYYL